MRYFIGPGIMMATIIASSLFFIKTTPNGGFYVSASQAILQWEAALTLAIFFAIGFGLTCFLYRNK
jgi:hypothetical protein